MSEQEKKQQRIYDLLNAKTKPKFLCLMYTKQKDFLQKKCFLRQRGSGRLNKKRKEGFLAALTITIKKDQTTSIKKPANE